MKKMAGEPGRGAVDGVRRGTGAQGGATEEREKISGGGIQRGSEKTGCRGCLRVVVHWLVLHPAPPVPPAPPKRPSPTRRPPVARRSNASVVRSATMKNYPEAARAVFSSFGPRMSSSTRTSEQTSEKARPTETAAGGRRRRQIDRETE
jgi:hypothetical protein